MPHELPNQLPHGAPHELPHGMLYGMPHKMPHGLPHGMPHGLPQVPNCTASWPQDAPREVPSSGCAPRRWVQIGEEVQEAAQAGLPGLTHQEVQALLCFALLRSARFNLAKTYLTGKQPVIAMQHAFCQNQHGRDTGSPDTPPNPQ